MAELSRGKRLTMLNVLTNPICVQHRRARMRLLPTATWALITVTIVTFIVVLVFLSLTEREQTGPVEAAKMALVPLIIVQGVLLMGMGTSAVATGIARERDQRLLDYHRMTPMSPASKIIGYMFGLPSREYFLFALTLPFVAWAVWLASVPLLKVAHFYTVFFSSVWLYHMTGLMAGMVSRKAWQSSFVSLGLVAALYLVLPLFARVGLSFFDFLTVRPTFYGMVAEELQLAHDGRPSDWITERMMLSRQYESIPFFGIQLNPTLFSLIVQVFALTAMYHVVRRKWVDAAWHPFSKRFAVYFVAGMTVLLAGTLWPLLHNLVAHEQLLDRIFDSSPSVVMGLLVGLFFVVSAVAILMSISVVTPTRNTVRSGLRRAKKLGKRKLPLSWDAASSLPATLLMLAIGLGGYVLVVTAIRDSAVYVWRPGMGEALLMLGVLGAAVVLAFQGMHERFGRRAVILGLFVLWVVPVMVSIVLLAAFDAWRPGMYIGAFCPAVAGGMSLSFLIDAAGNAVARDTAIVTGTFYAEDARTVIRLTVGFYVLLAVLAQVLRASAVRRWREAESATLSEPAGAVHVSPVTTPAPRRGPPPRQAAS